MLVISITIGRDDRPDGTEIWMSGEPKTPESTTRFEASLILFLQAAIFAQLRRRRWPGSCCSRPGCRWACPSWSSCSASRCCTPWLRTWPAPAEPELWQGAAETRIPPELNRSHRQLSACKPTDMVGSDPEQGLGMLCKYRAVFTN
jgi:hypothetical protein